MGPPIDERCIHTATNSGGRGDGHRKIHRLSDLFCRGRSPCSFRLQNEPGQLMKRSEVNDDRRKALRAAHHPVISDRRTKEKAVPLAVRCFAGRGQGRGDVPIRRSRSHSRGNRVLRRYETRPRLFAGSELLLNVRQAEQAGKRSALCHLAGRLNSGVVDYVSSHDVSRIHGSATRARRSGDSRWESPSQVVAASRRSRYSVSRCLDGTICLASSSIPVADDIVTFESYIALKNVVACGGPWMARREWIERQQFDKITPPRESVTDSSK